MAIVTSCCCGQSLRNGSFAAGIYSLGLYTVAITLATFHVITDLDDPVLFGLNVMLLVCSGLCVPSSVLLLIGLCVDSKLLLLPWILCTTVTTLIYVILSLYLLCDTKFHPLLLVFFLVDLVICSLNVYCLLCVISQYQEYLAGRGHPGQTTFSRTVPSVHLHTLPTRQETSKFITTPMKGHLGVNSPNNLQPDVSWREDSTSKSNICSELSYVLEEHIVQDISKAAGEHGNQEIPGSENARSDASLHNIVIVSSGSPTHSETFLETNHKNTSFDTNNSDLMELD